MDAAEELSDFSMSKKSYGGEQIIIVEDEFIVADDLRLTLEEAGNIVCRIASSVEDARVLLKSSIIPVWPSWMIFT